MKNIDDIDLVKIDRLLDKLEKDKKKQQTYNANTDSKRYIEDINKTLEIYSLALEEVSKSLELLGLSPYSEVLTKLFKGVHDHSLSILKFGLNNLKRVEILKESQQVQQQQSPLITGPTLIDNPDHFMSENNHFARDLNPSCVTLDERAIHGASPSARGWNGENQFTGRSNVNLLVPVPLNQHLSASPQSMTTFRNLTISPTSRVDVASQEETGHSGYHNGSVSPVNARRSMRQNYTPENDEDLQKFIREHEQMQKDINEVLKGKTVVEKLAPRKISIHLKQALKGLEFTNKKVNSIADNTLNDDDDDLEHPNFEAMGDRIKEAFNQAKVKAAKNLEGMLKTAKDGFRRGSPGKAKQRAKTVKLNQGVMRDAFTTTEEGMFEQDQKHEKELNEWKAKVDLMEQEKSKNEDINNKIATAYALCVRENRDLKAKVAILQEEIKNLKLVGSRDQESIQLQENNANRDSVPDSVAESQQEIEPVKKEDTRLQDLHREIAISLAEQKRDPIEAHGLHTLQKKREEAAGSISDPSYFKQPGSIQGNLDLARTVSAKSENVVESLANLNKATPKAENMKNNAEFAEKSDKASLQPDSAAGTLQNLDKNAQVNKEEPIKKIGSMGRAKSLGKIDGKVVLNSQNDISPNNGRNSTVISKVSPTKKNDSPPPKSSSDVRIKKQKTVLHMSQTVTERSPKNMKQKSELQTTRKPIKSIQPLPVPLETTTYKEKDSKIESSTPNNKSVQYKTPERRPKEAVGTINLSSGAIKSHGRVASSIDSRVPQLDEPEERSSEKNLGVGRSSPKLNYAVTSINFQKLGSVSFKKYHKSQPQTSRDASNGNSKEKDELLKDLREINTLNGISSLHKRRGSKSVLDPLFGNTGGLSDRGRRKGSGEESKDEEEEFSNSIHSARYTDSNSQSRKKNYISTDLWGMSPKFSKFKDDTEVQFYTPKVSSKFDPDIFGKIKVHRRIRPLLDTNRFDIGDFAGSLTQRRPFGGRSPAEHLNLHKHEILQIEKIRRPDFVQENGEEQGISDSPVTGRLPFPDRRKKGVGSYTEAPNLIHSNFSQSPMNNNREHENFSDVKFMRYSTTVKPSLGKLTIDECIMIEMVRETEDPATTKEEAQIRVMYRGVLTKVKQQPKFANYIRNLVYRDLQMSLNDDHPVVEYELFENFIRNFIESHIKCGDNCPHIKNFYSKIGYQTFWNNRSPLAVKKTEIGQHDTDFISQSPRLPNIAKKKKELIPELK